MLWQLRGRELGAVFLTHFHSDHIGDLGEVNTNAWLAGHPGSLQVFGGPGVVLVVNGFNQAYALDERYRTANSGPQILPSGVGCDASGRDQPCWPTNVREGSQKSAHALWRHDCHRDRGEP